MKKLGMALLCAVMLLGTFAISDAQRGDWRGGIRARIHDARASIERGIDRGTLTRHEAGRLRGELDRILYRIDRMRSDGDLSPRERDRIHRDLSRLERHIRREKRDDDTRWDRDRRDFDRRYR
ncbi:MAG: hypothetical protein WC291_10585 [Thermodesulfovibrionales bacterium]